FLRHARDHHPGLQPHLAVVGLQLARDQAQQGGLAGAVAADDAYAFAGLDRQVDPFEQQRTADAEVDALELEEGHGAILPIAPAGQRPRQSSTGSPAPKNPTPWNGCAGHPVRCGHARAGSSGDRARPSAADQPRRASSAACETNAAISASTPSGCSRGGMWPQSSSSTIRAGPATPATIRRGNASEPYSSRSPCSASTGQRTRGSTGSSDQSAKAGSSQVPVQASSTQAARSPCQKASLPR